MARIFLKNHLKIGPGGYIEIHLPFLQNNLHQNSQTRIIFGLVIK